MKRFLLLVFLITLVSIAYVHLQAKIVLLSYKMKKLYEQKQELVSEKQFYLAKLLDITSPDNIKESLIARQLCLSYSAPKKVVCINSTTHKPEGILDMLFGEAKAVADVLE